MTSRPSISAVPVFDATWFLAPAKSNVDKSRANNSTQGITRLVSFRTAPAPVPEELIAEVKAHTDSAGWLRPATDFEPGAPVTITRGSFVEIAAMIKAVALNHRVWILMVIMGRRSKLAVDPGYLRKLGTPAGTGCPSRIGIER